MRNFSIITNVYVIPLKNCRLPYYKFSKITRADIPSKGFDFVEIEGIKPDSCSFSETEKESDAGSYFEKTVKLEISKLRPEVSKLLDHFCNDKLVVLVKDANGFSHLVYPLTRSIKRSIPGSPKKANVTEVEFSGKGMYESPFVI